MIRVVHFLVGLVALDSRGQRAIEATMADWRHELAGASTTRRLVVNVRSIVGVARSLAKAGVAEFPSSIGSPFVLRLAAIATLWVIWSLKDGAPADTDRFFLVASQPKAWTLVAASLVPRVLVVLPLMIFLAEAVGLRRRVTPVAGTTVLLGAIVLLFGLVLLPASVSYLGHETWRYFANAAVAQPDFSFLWRYSILATLFAMVAVWLLFVFANRLRRVGSMRGWLIALGLVLVIVLMAALETTLARALLRIPSARNEVWIALAISRLVWTLAAILWATHRLARIEARRDAGVQIANNQ